MWGDFSVVPKNQVHFWGPSVYVVSAIVSVRCLRLLVKQKTKNKNKKDKIYKALGLRNLHPLLPKS